MARQFSSLRRRAPTKAPKARMVLVCEGKNTEPDYFRALRQNLNKQSLEIKVVEAAGVPMTVAQEALRQAKILKNSVGIEGDRVCAIFDRDEHPKFDEAIEFCRRHKIMVGYTNPCFELWLIWHFENYGANSHRHEVQKAFARLVPDYSLAANKTADFSKLMGGVDYACNWSKHHFDARIAEGARYGAPSSQLHEIIDCIKTFD
jgi:hypothetical protein